MAGIPAGRLSIELVADIARLQADLDKAKRAVSAASGDIARNARAANDNLASIGKGAGAGMKQFAQDVQRTNEYLRQLAQASGDVKTRIDAMSGVSGGMRRSADDIAAYGAELDRLRARYNPLFAVTQQYRQSVEEIRRAHAVGAISAGEMSAAISQQRQQTLASIGDIKGRTAAGQEAAAVAAKAAKAEEDYGKSIEQLRQQANPARAAQAQLNTQMALAEKAFREGRLAAGEYGQIIHNLQTRVNGLSTAGFGGLNANGKLASHQMLNLGFQFQDLGVQMLGAAQSSAPLKLAFTALVQQGSQIYGIMQQSGLGAKTFGAQILESAGIIKTAGNQALISAAQQAAANQAVVGSLAERAAASAATATAEVALARAAVANATTALEAAAANRALATAEGQAAGAAAASATAQSALAAAQGQTAVAATAARASMVTSFGAVGAAIVPIVAVLGTAALALKLLNDEANEGASMKAYAASLGLTAKEIKNLDNVTVTYGDTAKAVFQVVGGAIWSAIGPAVKETGKTVSEVFGEIVTTVKNAANLYIGYNVGAYNAIKAAWSTLPAVMGDVFYSAVNASIGAINSLIRASVDGVNGFIATANGILSKAGLQLPELSAPQIGKVANQYAGAGAKFGKSMKAEMDKAMGRDYLGEVGGAFSAQAQKNARERIRNQAKEKGYLDAGAGSGSKDAGSARAEGLARENDALEAQIRNLYALADAYGVSGAAALIAEARVKAESDAIKKRGDIEVFVNRQIRLAIAERVKDAAKASAAVREQTDAQAKANELLASGFSDLEASNYVKDRIADLPLLAALEAAQQRGLAAEATKATEALANQRMERERLREAEEKGKFTSDMRAGDNRLAELAEEMRLIGATDEVRVRALATIRATAEAQEKYLSPERQDAYIAQQVSIAVGAEKLAAAQRDYNDSLNFTADKWGLIADNIQSAGQGMADAFGGVGRAIGDMASVYADFQANRAAADAAHLKALENTKDQGAKDQLNTKYALATQSRQIQMYGDLASSAKTFFKEGSKGYKAVATAEKAFRAAEMAMALKSAAVQLGLIGGVTTARVGAAATSAAADTAFTGTSVANSGLRAAADGVAAVAKAIASLPFPLNIAAGAATAAVLASIGIAIAGSFGGNKNTLAKANTGTGTVLGDPDAKSESITRAIDQLREVDVLTSTYARQMASSLRSIESQIGGVASLVTRQGDINASQGVTEGFKANAIGSILSKIPLIGGFLGGLFGTKTTVVGSGLFGGPQSVGSILDNGFDASTYSDVKKKKSFFGLTTSTKYKTQYGEADAGLENQFTLILRQFNDAILAASGPLGQATSDIQNKLNSFVVNIGKVDLQDKTGEEIQEELSAIFGAAADSMASAAFPGMERFQKVGEGLFETLVRVASTVEAVTNSMGMLGAAAQNLSIDAKIGLANQFDSLGDMSSAIDGYFEAFYTTEEKNAAKMAKLTRVFDSLNVATPETLAGYRALVDAQDLNTAAGQATYATLLQLAPAFADLKTVLGEVSNAADIAAERLDLQRKLLEVQGNTAALRALDLAKLDASNRPLQEEIWALQDAQEAANAADELRKAWTSVGDSIMNEVNRIRGITDGSGAGGFAKLQGQFNAAVGAARGGDQEAAAKLVSLSQSLIQVAGNTATSRQELDRVKAQTAATLEGVSGLIGAMTGGSGSMSPAAALSAAAAAPQSANGPAAATAELVSEVRSLRQEVERLRNENNAGHAQTGGNTGRIVRKLDDVTPNGNAISVASAA